MIKKELVEVVSKKTGLPKKDVTSCLNACIDTVKKAVSSGDALKISGFGTLKRVEKAKKRGYNIKKQKLITIPAHRSVFFKVSKDFKRACNK